jgi:toxin secretion/phage lysis holin
MFSVLKNSKLVRRLEDMNRIYDFILCIGGAISVFLSWVFNGVSKDLLTVLAVVMLIDLILGVAKGITIKSISSKVFSLGVTKKILRWLLLGGVSVCEYAICSFIGVEGNTHVFTTFFIGAYILGELISVVENANDLGLGVPSWVKPLLLVIRREKVDKMPSFVGAALAQYLKLDINNEDVISNSDVENIISNDADTSGIEPEKSEIKSDSNNQSD